MANLIWTEQEPNGAAWRDCTYCSLLMVLVAAGKANFPKGIYTHAERQAFRGGDSRDNFEGGVARAASRYGVAINRLPIGSEAALRAAMSRNGSAYAVAGKLSNFPRGHMLRAFAPNFIGFHAIAVIPDGAGKVKWMDPLAPMRTLPKTVPVEDVMTFARGNYPNDARYLAVAQQDDDVNLKGTNQRPIHNRVTKLKFGGYLVADPTAMPYQNLRVVGAGNLFSPSWQVTGNTILNTDQWYGGWVFPEPATFGYLSLGLFDPAVPLQPIEDTSGYTQDELDGAAAAAAFAVADAAVSEAENF